MCVIPPQVAVIVIVRVPVAALDVVLIFIVEVPDPGAAIEDGLNVIVSLLSSPVAERLIGELKLPDATVLIATLPELPRTIEIDVGEAESVNAAGEDDVIVNEIVAVCVIPPPVPLILIG